MFLKRTLLAAGFAALGALSMVTFSAVASEGPVRASRACGTPRRASGRRTPS